MGRWLRHRPSGMNLRPERSGITRAMGPSTSWDPWPRPVARAAVGMQECTQIGENGLSAPFWGICVHCCDAVGRRGDAGVYTDRRKWPLCAVLGHLCTLLRCCGQTWGRRSVHKWENRASPRRFGAFVYTVATRVAIRIATRAASGGTSASATTACRRRPLAGPSRLVGKTGSARVAPLPG